MARQLTTIAPGAYRSLHEKLLAAIAARDPAAATDMMRAHYRELDLDFATVISGRQ